MRNKHLFTLWWTAEDKQADMWCGDYPTEAAAWGAKPGVEQELLEQCEYLDREAKAECEAGIRSGSWIIEPPIEDND